ncbi:MAG TPA: YaiI/YqxD family protein, partial [Sphingomonas sp.]|uniref:YaiI/YqxD family protein n=1 Tax=Sphingomonas sp. TaxID=28214 RepID=UPI002C1957C1
MASIWVDADACPGVIKEILFRAAKRTGVDVTLIANQALQVPRIPSVRAVQVSAGFDVADAEIVKRIIAGDLVVTADIPLAADVIAKGAEALNPRGERYSPDTIRGVLAMRDFMDT